MLACPATRPSEHIALAVRKPGEAALDLAAFGFPLVIPVQRVERGPHGCQQNLIIERLLEKIDGPDLHGFDGERNIAMTRDDNHRHRELELPQSPQQVDAADLRHAHVGNDAARLDLGRDLQKRGREVVGLHLDPGRAQQEGKRLADRLVIVDDVDDGSSDGIAEILLHVTARSVKRKIVPPRRIGLRADLSAMGLDNGAGDRQADAHAVALGGDKRLEQPGRHSGAIPQPVSATLIATMSSLVEAAEITSSRLGEASMASMALRMQIEQDLLNLHLIGKHEIDCRVELKSHADALILGAYERQRAGFLDELLDAFDPTLALAARDEIAQAADDLSGTQRLVGGLVHRIAEHCGLIVAAVFEQPSRTLHVVRDGRQWLVELVRQRRRHLAHRGQSGHMDELGLQFL